MPGHQPSEKVRAILNAAASSPDLLDMLVENREKALARMGLTPAESASLMALDTEQLVGMVRRQAPQVVPWRALKSRMVLLAGIVAALVIYATLSSDEAGKGARAGLIRISIAEGLYRQEHGSYGDLQDLVRAGVLTREWIAAELEKNEHYEFEVAPEGDGFAATARHWAKPGRPGYRVGPEGKVTPLE